MTASRSYSQGDRTALIALSAGRCYWPSCNEALVRLVEGSYKTAVDIAHIRALNGDGERYDSTMTNAERNSFNNLIFLCRPHHQTIDEPGASKKYTVAILNKWKDEREKGGYDQLRGLRDLTEDRLQVMINDAMLSRDQDINNTLKRLECTDSSAAALVRELRDELNEIRVNGSLLNVDAVEMLSSAAHDLHGLYDAATILNSAAQDLRNLQDAAQILSSATDQLGNLQGLPEVITAAADRLQRAANSASQFL